MFTFKNIFLVVSFLAAVVFAYLYFTKKCGTFDTSMEIRDSLNRFITYRQKDSSTIVEQNQFILKQKDAIEAGALREKQLKKYVAQVRIETKESRSFSVPTKPSKPEENPYFTPEEVDSILIARKDSVQKLPPGHAVVDTNLVHQVPRPIVKDDQWFTLRGRDEKDSTHFDVVAFYNKMELTIGSRRMGFFKARKPLVLFENQNPYSETLNMENVVIKFKEPFYKRPWFIAAATVVVIEGVRYSLKRL